MASQQAEAVNQMYRQMREQPVDTSRTIEETRVQSNRIADGTAEPSGVSYVGVDAGGVAAQWVIPDGAARDRVIVYLHGGGYCFCSMGSHSKLVGHLATAAGCRGLNLEYRLAPENPYPAALDDVVTAYRWLLDSGVEARNIALAGDSAGGGLAAAALLKLRDDGVPLPGAAVLLSPWLDLELTGESVTGNVDADLLVDAAGALGCAEMYLAGQDPRDPYASPLHGDPRGLPPLYVQVGGDEIFLDDGRRFAAAAEQAGVEVRLDLFPEMQHVHQLFAGNMPEADDAVTRIGEVLRERLGLAAVPAGGGTPR